MTEKMSLKTLIMRNPTAGVTVAHSTGIKPGMMTVEIEVTKIGTDITMKTESMAPTLEILTTEAGAP